MSCNSGIFGCGNNSLWWIIIIIVVLLLFCNNGNGCDDNCNTCC